jgi:hypothetical protein
MKENTQENWLSCPKRGQWSSFRLVDEHGNGEPYAGLAYTLHDRQGLSHSGILDAEGYAKLDDHYCGPLRLNLSAPYQGGEKWYEDLLERESFPLPLTALQVAAEQSPSGPRQDGKTYLAQERATQENAVFFRVEVRDFTKHGEAAHLPQPGFGGFGEAAICDAERHGMRYHAERGNDQLCYRTLAMKRRISLSTLSGWSSCIQCPVSATTAWGNSGRNA